MYLKLHFNKTTSFTGLIWNEAGCTNNGPTLWTSPGMICRYTTCDVDSVTKIIYFLGGNPAMSGAELYGKDCHPIQKPHTIQKLF